MSPVKQEILEWAETLPDECTWEDVQYFFYVREKVAEGLKDIDAGRVISHADAKRSMRAES